MARTKKIAFLIGAGLSLYWLNSSATLAVITKDSVEKDVENISDTIESSFTTILNDRQARLTAKDITASSKPYESLYTRTWLNLVQFEIENELGTDLTFEKMQTIQFELQNVFKNTLQYKRSYLTSYFKGKKYTFTQTVKNIDTNLLNVAKYL